jgi:hypothetical protein
MALKEIEKGKNYVVYTDGKAKSILLKGVRFSYPHFGSKHVQKDEDGNERASWGGVAMLDKDTHEAAKNALEKIIKELLAQNDDAKVAKDKRCLRDGDADDEGDIGAELKNHWYVSFKENAESGGGRAPIRPAVRNEFGKLMIEPEKAHDPDYVRQAIEAIDTKFYGGCYGNVLIRPWFFAGKAKNSSKTFPKRVSAGYGGVQFTKDGTPFGNGRIDESSAAWDSDGSDDGLGGNDDDI